MSRVAILFVVLAAPSAGASDLPPGTVRLGDDRFRAGGSVDRLVLSPDGKRYATVQSAGEGILALTVWEAATGRPLHERYVNRELFCGLVWGPGGAFAVTAGTEPAPKGQRGKTVPHDFRVWDFTEPDTAPPLLPPPESVERTGGTITDRAPKRDGEYTGFLFSADGTRIAVRWESAEGKIAIHVFALKPAATSAKLTRIATIDLGAEGAGAVRISADGKTLITFRVLANSSAMTATVWDVASGKSQPSLLVSSAAAGVPPLALDTPTHGRITHRLMLTPDGRSLVLHAAEEKEWGFDVVPLFPSYNSAPPRRVQARLPYGSADSRLFRAGEHDSGAYEFFPSGEALVVSTLNDKTRVIDVTTGKELGRLEGHAGAPTAVAVSADGKTIATADTHGLIRLWNAKTLRPLDDGTGHRAPVEHAELSPDGKRLLTWAGDQTVRLWDLATGAELRAFNGVVAGDDRPAFTPDGTGVVFRTKERLVARDLLTGLEVPLPGDRKGRAPRADSALTPRSPDGRTAARSARPDRREVELLESTTGTVRRVLGGHRGDVRVLGFTPDGTKLLTAGGDHTVLVWDVRLQNAPLPDALKKETDAAKLWNVLATGKADAAYFAMARLAREPDAAVKLAKMKLKPVAKGGHETDAAKLTDTRAIELLEALDTDDTRALLKELAGGRADAFRTQEAKRALERNRR